MTPTTFVLPVIYKKLSPTISPSLSDLKRFSIEEEALLSIDSSTKGSPPATYALAMESIELAL